MKRLTQWMILVYICTWHQAARQLRAPAPGSLWTQQLLYKICLTTMPENYNARTIFSCTLYKILPPIIIVQQKTYRYFTPNRKQPSSSLYVWWEYTTPYKAAELINFLLPGSWVYWFPPTRQLSLLISSYKAAELINFLLPGGWVNWFPPTRQLS